MKNENYWNTRAKNLVKYKNEFFYTVTPLPYYYKRRQILIEHISQYINKHTEILDFGCGDGKYINYFFTNKKTFVGVDLSSEMIKIASEKNQNAKFYVSKRGLKGIKESASLIYSIAVFAHILDNKIVENLFKDIYYYLPKDGQFIIFEQTKPGTARKGTTFIRRNGNDYIKFAKNAKFKVEKNIMVSFPFHRYFEKYIAKYFYKFYSIIGQDPNITANKSIFFRSISRLFLFFDKKPIKDFNTCEGNTFYVFKK